MNRLDEAYEHLLRQLDAWYHEMISRHAVRVDDEDLIDAYARYIRAENGEEEDDDA